MKIIFFSVFVLFVFFPSLIRAEILEIPFVEQAPDQIWKQPWYDFCEEASLVMVDAFYQNKTITSLQEKKANLLYIDSIKRKFFGVSLDESVETLVTFINNFLPWEGYVVTNPSVDQIKEEIKRGNPVIAPMYGKLLKNPHFRREGPRYHVIVIHGFDDLSQSFITHEPGTSRGKNYAYPYSIIMEANHDLISFGSMLFGKRKMIFTRSELTSSLQTDGDADGLKKGDELLLGTSLLYADTDSDGYLDGVEVENGYSPLVNEKSLANGSLVKEKDSPAVYRLFDGKKHLFSSEFAFVSRNYSWQDVSVVSKRFLQMYASGQSIE